MSGIIEIAGKVIGATHPVYMIAEMSANHGGSLDNAVTIVHLAADAGFDAIKLQTYRPDTITFDSSDPEYWIKEGTWESRRLYDLYAEAQTPWEWTPTLIAEAKSRGIALFSSPFDETAVDFLEKLDVPAYKVASFELTHLPLLRRIAATGKPVIVSNGMATFEELDTAISTLRDHGATQLAALKCTSSYPAEGADLNLSLIPRMITDFNIPTGYSDHSLGSSAAIAAVALGASIVEKHIQMAADLDTADSFFSMRAEQLAAFVSDVRMTRIRMGDAQYGPVPSENYLRGFRRSIIAIRDISAGQRIGVHDLGVRRPAIGAEPMFLERLIGSVAKRNIQAGQGVNMQDIEIG